MDRAGGVKDPLKSINQVRDNNVLVAVVKVGHESDGRDRNSRLDAGSWKRKTTTIHNNENIFEPRDLI
jgi:hypothetical protein